MLSGLAAVKETVVLIAVREFSEVTVTLAVVAPPGARFCGFKLNPVTSTIALLDGGFAAETVPSPPIRMMSERMNKAEYRNLGSQPAPII